VIDLVLFAVFCRILKGKTPAYIAFSTVLARVISAIYNYLVNYKLVFGSKQKVAVSGLKYFVLAVAQMSLSALLVTAGSAFLPALPEVAVKVVVDTILFFISYKVQQKYIF
jgi:putative flippase GtrA